MSGVRLLILAAGFILAVALSTHAQMDPCEVRPDLPQCSTPKPPDPIVETPAGDFVIPVIAAAILGVVAGGLVILKFFGFLDVWLDAWRRRQDDRIKYGHPHKRHHGKR